MVNWHDPVLLKNDYFAFIKLSHAIAGIYMWETVFTTGFELDVLRRKRPYKWTIWLYLGTRYGLLFAFILLMIYMNRPGVPCQSLIMVILVLIYISWESASLIIVLRIIAIWNRNTIVSLIAVGVLLSGPVLNIRHLTIITVTYTPLTDSCTILHTHRALVNAIGVLVIDVVLLLMMLIGLLRQASRNSIGIWKLLYQQCIIWLALAFLAEIPPVVLLILNLNDAWNEMLLPVGMAILCIGAARMYRSLCDRGSLTEYVSSDQSQFVSKASSATAHPEFRGANVYGPMCFSPATQSEETRNTYETPTFLPADQIRVEFVPGRSIPNLVQENTKDKTDSAGYGAV